MIKSLLCSSVLLMLVYSGISHADEHFPLLGQVKRGPVNVRAGANTNFEIIFKLTLGDQCVVLGKNFEWYKIQVPSLAEAYVRADYVKDLEGSYGELIGDKVNVRSKPKSESSPLCQLIKGDFVRLLEKKGNWWRIEPPAAAAAWVHSDFLLLSNEEIPKSLLRQNITLELVKDAKNEKPVRLPETVIPDIKIVGIIQPLADAIVQDIHYALFIDGKPAYYIEDVPHLDRFKNAKVKIEAVSINGDKPLEYPLINIKKIAVLL